MSVQEPKTSGAARVGVIVFLRFALLVALYGVGWSVYRGLPGDEGVAPLGAAAGGETTLRIVLRMSPAEAPGRDSNIPIDLYPFDLGAMQREFLAEQRPGVRFEDFLKRRVQGRSPVTTRLDRNGEATVHLPAGEWWIHATLPGPEDLEWLLPVNVYGRQQTVVLNSANLYARTKSF